MSFAPALPLTGYAGWALLKRSQARQTAAFAAAPEIRSDEAYFRAKIGSIDSAEALVKDRRLLKVALGAFGLDSDINNRFFIQKVLEDGTLKTGTLAGKLANKQYLKLSAAFGFGDYSVPRTKLSDFADGIVAAYKDRQFEIAVGAQDDNLRLALNVQRELPQIAGKATSSDTSKWFAILGNPPLRQVFETALGLPSGIGKLDLDQQLLAFRAKAKAQLGNAEIATFSDPDKVEALVRRFLVRSEAAQLAGSAGSNAALQMLQQTASFARSRSV